MARTKKIIHLVINGENHYFPTIAAIFREFTPDDLGIGKEALWNYGIKENHPFQNKHCIIRKGVINK